MEHLIRRCDVVYHLAAAVGVRWIIDHPLLSIRTNVRATEIVLEQTSRHEKPVLIASTSEIYGKNEARALREDDDSIIGSTQITRWLYANSKATDEFLAFAYHRERGLPVVIARSSIRSAPARAVSTAWWCPASCSRRCGRGADRLRRWAADPLLHGRPRRRDRSDALDGDAGSGGTDVQCRQPPREHDRGSGPDGDPDDRQRRSDPLRAV